jgi:CHRD domain/PEP-CTERM motif
MRILLRGVCACAVLLGAVSAQAAMWKFDVVLDGLQEVPPIASAGYGSAMAMLDDATGMIDISGSFADMLGTSIDARLYGPAAAGANGASIFALTYDVGVTSGNFSGSNTLAAANITNALNDLTYINIRSTLFPNGELRGQLIDAMRVPEPASLTLAGVGFALAGTLRRRLRR